MYSLILFLSLLMTNVSNPKSIHEFEIRKLNSEEVLKFSEFKGKKILIVNVASKCGFTPQYEGLEKLYELYSDKLVVVGFPCNQFLYQEPGSELEIQTFCTSTYNVKFPMTEKINVKGSDQHPIYKFLTSKELNGLGDFSVSWNFNKFLLDEEGKLVAYYGSKTKPLDQELLNAIEQ